MATENITLNTNQTKVLKDIVASGKVDFTTGIDKRSVNALAKRGLVKITETKKNTFVAPTAKGKKYLN